MGRSIESLGDGRWREGAEGEGKKGGVGIRGGEGEKKMRECWKTKTEIKGKGVYER